MYHVNDIIDACIKLGIVLSLIFLAAIGLVRLLQDDPSPKELDRSSQDIVVMCDGENIAPKAYTLVNGQLTVVKYDNTYQYCKQYALHVTINRGINSINK